MIIKHQFHDSEKFSFKADSLKKKLMKFFSLSFGTLIVQNCISDDPQIDFPIDLFFKFKKKDSGHFRKSRFIIFLLENK